MKQKLFTLLTLLLCAVSTTWAEDYTWIFNQYCTDNNISAGSNANISRSATTKVSTSNSVDLSYVTGNNSESRIYNLSDAATVGDVNYSSYLYMGGGGSTYPSTGNLRYFITGNISGRGNLTIVYAGTVAGSCYIYNSTTASNTDDALATIAPVASKAVTSSTIDLGAGAPLVICHSSKCYIYAIIWTAESETGISVSYSVNPSSAGTIMQSPIGSKIEEGTKVTFTATANTGYEFVNWTDDNNNNAELGTDKTYEIESLAKATSITANFRKLNSITFVANGGTGSVPTTQYVIDNADYVIPNAYFMYKTGNTLVGWDYGNTTYAAGQTISNITEDITLTANFTTNTVSLGNEKTTVNWTFDKAQGPVLNCENSEIDYVQHTTINQTPLDVVMHVNTKPSTANDNTMGKLNNTNQEERAQVNAGTIFTVPVIPGAIITYTTTNGTVTKEDVSFGGEKTGKVDGKKISYTYEGNANTLDIIDLKGGFYPSGISVEYPKVIAEPSSAEDNSIILTYTSGSVSNKTWTGSDNCVGYTIATDEEGNIGQKNNEKFAFGYGGTYTITVPEDMTVTSFKISAQANSSTSYVTYNGAQKSFDNSSVTDQKWTIANPTAGGSIIFSVETKQLNVTSITLYTSDIILTTTDNMAGWRAFYDADNSYSVDENTTVFVAASEPENGKITLTSIEGIPAGIPVILHTTSSADSYKMTLTKATVDGYDGTNKLQYTKSAVNNVYRLGYGDNGVGFYPYSGTPASGAVILNVSSANAGNAKALTFSFSDVTGISNAAAAEAANAGTGKMYNLSGQIVGEGYKGIVIVNGKKVIK